MNSSHGSGGWGLELLDIFFDILDLPVWFLVAALIVACVWVVVRWLYPGELRSPCAGREAHATTREVVR
jgi:hypothetical protein